MNYRYINHKPWSSYGFPMGRAQPPTRQRMGPATTSRGEAQLSLRELRDEVSGVPPAMSCHDKCRSANGTKTQWVNVGDVIPKKTKMWKHIWVVWYLKYFGCTFALDISKLFKIDVCLHINLFSGWWFGIAFIFPIYWE